MIVCSSNKNDMRGIRMILLIDTTNESIGMKIASELENSSGGKSYEYIDASNMNISHCIGCNFCWLKTPGQCVIKDEYEPLLKKMSKADQVWLISDTKFGFVSYKTKNIVDRVMPIVTMNLHIVGNQMRHITRYDKNPNWGVIYSGDGDKDYLSWWCERVAINFGSKSLGVFSENEYKEAISCM